MNASALFSEALTRAAECLGLSLADEHTSLMFAHYERMIDTNRSFNLTRLTEPDQAAVKLYADSLAPLAWLGEKRDSISTVLDVGSGAGFPAIPLAIACPQWRVTAIDSTAKKVRFIQRCAAEIQLDNLCALQARAGEWKPPARYDLVLFKAVASLGRCVPLAKNLVARGGHAVFFTGPNLKRAEIDTAEASATSIGLRIWDTFDYDLPWKDETLEHSLFVFRRP